MPKGLKNVNLSFNPEQFQELTELAIAEGVTAYTYCKRLILQNLATKNRKRGKQTKRVIKTLLEKKE